MSAYAARLEQIAERYRHFLSEHRRAGVESSGRRHLRARLDDAEREFEQLLLEAVDGEEERAAWRDRLRHGSTAPQAPPSPGALAFKGRSEGGSIVEVRRREDGDHDVVVDGAPVDRLGGAIDFDTYVDGDRRFPEVFDAPPEARSALLAWVADPSGAAPLEHLHDLVADGLVDRHFGLTGRGRRFLARAAA